MITSEQSVKVDTCPRCKSLGTKLLRMDFMNARGKKFCLACGAEYDFEVDKKTGEVKKTVTNYKNSAE